MVGDGGRSCLCSERQVLKDVNAPTARLRVVCATNNSILFLDKYFQINFFVGVVNYSLGRLDTESKAADYFSVSSFFFGPAGNIQKDEAFTFRNLNGIT